MPKVQRALISVSDKAGLLDLAKVLNEYKVELIASGGTAQALRTAGYAVTPVESLTGHAEAFQGRMKTISFEIASALLFRREDQDDLKQAEELNIKPIDLVIVNLYPFHQVLRKNASPQEIIENIDIGGVNLLRAGAKNFSSVTVLSQPTQYGSFIEEFKKQNGYCSFEYRAECATQAFSMTAFYDLEIAKFMTAQSGKSLRYGENPHQKAVLLKNPFSPDGLAHRQTLQGKEMSYNNFLDADYALETLKDLCAWQGQGSQPKPTAVIVKHNTPCGVAISEDPMRALEKAWMGDEKSSFGGVIALNIPVTEKIADFFKDRFIEVLMAPKFEAKAQEVLKKNCRLIEIDLPKHETLQARSIEGGLLLQDKDSFTNEEFKTVTTKNYTDTKAAQFAMLCVKNLKSNAIALCANTNGDYELLTMGSGQTNRIDCIEKLITERLKQKNITDLSHAVLASDAFFPFADSVQAAAKLGVGCIVQPGGSIKDNEVISEANKLGVAMMFTGRRHFLH
jgi:phosphoribosylaminoimidazolecarboxamide formyltransferase/IMP cyclohydrolase